MKKLFSILMVFCFAAMLVSCSSEETKSKNSSENNKSTLSTSNNSAYETKEFKGASFEINPNYEVKETDSALKYYIDSDREILIVMAGDLSDKMDDKTAHATAISGFMNQFENIESEDYATVTANENEMGTASFNGTLGGNKYFCSTSSIIGDEYQYTVSYMWKIDTEDTHLDEYHHVLETLEV